MDMDELNRELEALDTACGEGDLPSVITQLKSLPLGFKPVYQAERQT